MKFAMKSSNELADAAQQISKYEPFLHQIAHSFGFSSIESIKLVQEASHQVYEHYTKQEICCPLKVFLTKNITHKCIFKISSQLFSQSTTDRNYSSNFVYTGDTRLQKMPLNLRVTYLLNVKFKFNESEIAKILNTTSMQVKERLQKAFTFIKTH